MGGVPGWVRFVNLGLARAYVLAGGTARARAAYMDFPHALGRCDPDIPILIAAKG